MDPLKVNISFNPDPIVEQWAIYVLDRWVGALHRFGIGQTRELERSFVKELQRAGGNIDQVIFKFLKYGRFPDMGVGRGQTLNGLVENRRFDRYRNTEGKMTGKLARKKKPWYTKTFYREVAKLTALFQEQGAQQLLQVMESNLSRTINIPH